MGCPRRCGYQEESDHLHPHESIPQRKHNEELQSVYRQVASELVDFESFGTEDAQVVFAPMASSAGYAALRSTSFARWASSGNAPIEDGVSVPG
jgi:hypothetical protein